MTDFVSAEEIKKAKETAYEVADIISARYDHTPKAFVHTYGCQGNLADSERLKGMLKEMGYEMTEDIESADFILYNTCAIREHAEDRVFGNIGAIKRLKKEKETRNILRVIGVR